VPEGKYAFLRSTSEHLPVLPHRFCWWYRELSRNYSQYCHTTLSVCWLTVWYCFHAPWLCIYELVKKPRYRRNIYFFPCKVYPRVYYMLVLSQFFILIEWEMLVLKYEFYKHVNFSKMLPRRYRNLEINV